MKKRLFFVASAFLLFTILIQCNMANKNGEESVDELKKSLNEKNKILQNRKKELTENYTDVIEIISLKYEIDTTLSKNIIVSYLVRTDPYYDFISSDFDSKKIKNLSLSYRNKSSIVEFADSIAFKHKTIDKKTIGKILLDLETIKHIKDIEI